MIYLTNSLLAFLITTNLLFILQSPARKIKLVDKPNNRKLHKGEVPLIGGIAIFCGFTLALLLSDYPLSGLRDVFAGVAILMIVGILDDLHELSPQQRLMAEVIVALLVSVGTDTLIYNIGAIHFSAQNIQLGLLALPLTVVFIVGTINAFNMIDGIDGLAGSLALVILSALMLAAWITGLTHSVPLLLFLIASITAFLGFNFPLPWRSHALVFMGSAGSTFLGLILAWLMIYLSQGKQSVITSVTALWFLALPLMDAVNVLCRRIVKGRSPFRADREHLHHLLLEMGLTVPQVLVVMLSLAIGTVGIGLLGLYLAISEAILFWGFIGVFMVYFVSMVLIWENHLERSQKQDDVKEFHECSIDMRKLPREEPKTKGC